MLKCNTNQINNNYKTIIYIQIYIYINILIIY